MSSDDRENARLLAQAEAFASDEHIEAEVARWRDASPEERLAETWRLCAMVPGFRAMWPEELRQRAARAEPLPPDTVALLERMKAQGRAP